MCCAHYLCRKTNTKPLRLMKILFSYGSLSIKVLILLTPLLDYCLSLKYSLWFLVLVMVGNGLKDRIQTRPNQTRPEKFFHRCDGSLSSPPCDHCHSASLHFRSPNATFVSLSILVQDFLYFPLHCWYLVQMQCSLIVKSHIQNLRKLCHELFTWEILL